MKLHTKTLLAAATACTLVVGSADAVSILYVGDGNASTTSGILTTAGHTVTQFNSATYGFNLSSNDGVNYAEGFDVVVIGAEVNFGGIRSHGAVWNGLSNGGLILAPYLGMQDQGSSNSWSWFDTPAGPTSPVINAADTIAVLDTASPLFNGVTLTPGTPPTVDLIDTPLNTRYGNITGETLLANTQIVATKSGDANLVYIATADAGALQSGGGARIYMPGPASDGTYYTAAGQTVLLNAIDTLVPEPSSLALLGLGGLLIARRRRG